LPLPGSNHPLRLVAIQKSRYLDMTLVSVNVGAVLPVI
jgi:hypothetical protein